nr:unnamed protein product [Naegleria fowleri]
MYEKVLILYHTSNNKFKQLQQQPSAGSRMRSDSLSSTFRLYQQPPPSSSSSLWTMRGHQDGQYEHSLWLDLYSEEVMADGGGSNNNNLNNTTNNSNTSKSGITIRNGSVHHHDEMIYGGQVLALKE